jgi:hypothetical protein
MVFCKARVEDFTWYFLKYRYRWMNRFVTSTNDDGINKLTCVMPEVVLVPPKLQMS